MKKILIAFSAIAFMASCETKVAGDSATDAAAIADKHVEGTKKVFRAIETGDVSGLDSLFTEDVIDHNAGPKGEDIVGRDSVKAAISKMHTYMEGIKFEVLHHATSPDGQYHYATSRMTGKATAANPWGAPAGTAFDDMSVEVVKMKDGKCSEHWSFASMKDVGEWMSAAQQGGKKPEEKKTVEAVVEKPEEKKK